ncbi:MAG: hypothetical protein MR028_00725 [Ligilactobacillus agilis]|uniref:hypothetical protein n=1 Tax=Ligilactobacillus agilis TaxID=1601 RepID=UPI00242F7846|nr:hypothetical protein [Ligilactobacillus agilis]MCI5760935.1 hypothetical protein [Ligilactobacillus agilis]
MRLVRAIFKMTLKKKETKVFLTFSVFPMLMIIINLFNTKFMQLSAPKNSLGFIDFFQATQSVQYQIVLPILAIIYLVTSSIHDEIFNGTLFLYKDIARRKIINSKLISFILVYDIFFILTFTASLITYYTSLIGKEYTSGKFLSGSISDLNYSLLGILAVFLMFHLSICLATCLSVRFNNGITLLVTTIFILFSFIAPHLNGLKYLFPNGYLNELNHYGVGLTLLLMIIVSVIYMSVFIFGAYYGFRKVEY